jgi:hypothetical protein
MVGSTHSSKNGGASGALRDKVTFQANIPVAVILAFDPPTEARPGRFGEQFMYFLEEDRIMFAEPELHEEIVRAGAAARDHVTICKRELRNAAGRRIQWEVSLLRNAALPNESAAAHETRLQHRAAAAPAIAPTAAPPRTRTETLTPPFTVEASTRPNLMAEALAQAIEACELNLFDARPEDIRALAITIYITATGGKR